MTAALDHPAIRRVGFDAPRPPAVIRRLRVEEFEQLQASGVYVRGEHWELLDGEVVYKDRSTRGEDPISVGYPHTYVVGSLQRLTRDFDPHPCHLRCQQPVRLPLYNKPEPDGAVVRGKLADYLDHDPAADEIVCVIEVSDSSVGRDRGTKAAVYAAAGIPLYVMFDIPAGDVKVMADPVPDEERYAKVTTFRRGDALALPTADGGSVDVAVGDLLPDPPAAG